MTADEIDRRYRRQHADRHEDQESRTKTDKGVNPVFDHCFLSLCGPGCGPGALGYFKMSAFAVIRYDRLKMCFSSRASSLFDLYSDVGDLETRSDTLAYGGQHFIVRFAAGQNGVGAHCVHARSQ